jgi:hypothetical protein
MKNHRIGSSWARIARTRAFLGATLFALFSAVGSFGCESQVADPTGGETHFLRICDPEGDLCGDGLTCLCGVCTDACSVEDPCAGYPGAQCVVPPPSCSDVVERSCDVACRSNEECRGLSGDHFCIDGWCRLAPEEPLTSGSGGAAQVPVCEPSGVAGNEVVILGDTFFATTHEVTAYLETEAREAGVLSAGERYRDYSNMTSNSLGVPGDGILGQYQAARDEAPVEVVILNGGGADVLIGTCDDPVDSECPLLVDAAGALDAVFQEMSADGVSAILFVGYPDPQVPEVREEMDALRPLLEAACQASAAPCSFLDLRESFSGKEGEYIAEDGLNPTSLGSAVAASAIWQLMVDGCIAQ